MMAGVNEKLARHRLTLAYARKQSCMHCFAVLYVNAILLNNMSLHVSEGLA